MKTQGLQHRPDGWYFRLTVPATLRPRVGTNEVVRRLGKVSQMVAEAQVRALRMQLREEFRRLRACPEATTSTGAICPSLRGSPVSDDLQGGPYQAASLPPVVDPTPGSASQLTADGLGEVWIAEKLAAGDWCVEQVSQVRHVLATFVALHGRRPVHEYGRPEVARFKAYVQGLGRSTTTVNRYLTLLGGFMRWAHFAGYRQDNPVEGQKLRKRNGHSAQNERAQFTQEELETVFSVAFTEATSRRPAWFWLPVIMRYSGLRPEEAAQLRGKDIHKVDGALCFDLRGAHLVIKSDAGRRLVPVHGALVEGLFTLAFPAGDERIFPELNPGHNGRLAEAPSRWFNRTWLRQRCGIKDQRKVLYSLRHTVASTLKAAGQEEALIAELLGHTHPNLTYGRYGKAYPVDRLQQAVALL
jgi:integrase